MINSLKDRFIDKLLKTITKNNKQIKDLQCCGNCGNVFYGVESNNNLTISNKAVKICSASHDLFRDDHVCKHWIYDGKTKEERKG